MRNKSAVKPSLGPKVAAISLVFCLYAGILWSGTLPLGAQETPPATETLTATTVHAPLVATRFMPGHAIVLLLVVFLALLFYLLLRWSQKSEQAAYLGQVYVDTVRQFEYNRLFLPIKQKLESDEYDREVRESGWMTNHPEPEEPEPDEDLRPYVRRYFRPYVTEPPGLGGYGGGGRTLMPGSGTGGLGGSNAWESNDPGGYWRTPAPALDDEREQKLRELPEEIRGKITAFGKEWQQYVKESRKWLKSYNAEKMRRYDEDIKSIRTKSEQNAEKALDVNFEVFRGRGHTFVLEFTAIVVIIFAAVIGGVLTILTGEQIGTLLAAIAGYVLGRAVTREPAAAQEGGDRSQLKTLQTREPPTRPGPLEKPELPGPMP